MKKIDSKNNNYIKQLSKLGLKKEIIDQELFLVEGNNLIKEAINSEVVVNLLITKEEMYPNIDDTKKIKVTNDIIKKLSHNRSNEGAIAVCKYEPITVHLSVVNKIIVLENINDPGNLGTIIRSSLAFGFDAVITLGESVFAYNDKVLRASQGSMFKIPVMQLKDFKDLHSFKAYKFCLQENTRFLRDITIEKSNDNKHQEKFALVFGNEARGLSKDILNNWEGENVKIDIKSIDSLNIAATAAIALNKFK